MVSDEARMGAVALSGAYRGADYVLRLAGPMTHLFTFIGSVVLLVTYVSVVYSYWLRRDNYRDKADAVFMTLVTTFVSILLIAGLALLWDATK